MALENPYDYLVCLHLARTGNNYEVWLVTVREPLPRIKVPLDEGIPDIPLDLQTVFNRNYDEGAYVYQIDYTSDPVPPLRDEDTVWANALLREKGLRS